MNDYGTAYSSLARLRELPLTGLKLDKSFIDTIYTNPTSAILVAGVVAPAKAPGLKTTAEGVERETQLSVVRELGRDTFQCYLSSRPLPPAELDHAHSAWDPGAPPVGHPRTISGFDEAAFTPGSVGTGVGAGS